MARLLKLLPTSVEFRSMRRRILKLGAIVAVLASATLAGCSCEISAGTSDDSEDVDTAAVELVIHNGLTEQSGVPPLSVDCPDGMVQEEGKRYQCTAVHPQDGEHIVDVTMKSGQGFDWLTR